jgi:hypothetical protein
MAGWGGWGRGSSAPTDPKERDRRHWLTTHGITPMSRSTRLWDMEVTPPRYLPHYRERVGSLDMARRQLQQQREGMQVEPIKWQGSRDMATGRAYDWCTCIEAVVYDADGRTACTCTCASCKPPKGATAVHWRKRMMQSQLRAQFIRDKYKERRGWWRRKIDLIEYWVWCWETRGTHGDPQPAQGGDTPPMPDSEWPTQELDPEDE